jgi:dTDP-glucose 4,6-dehydratase
MKIFVTGGCGFIGSAFIRSFSERADQILNYDALTYAGSLYGVKEVASENWYEFVHGDVCDPLILARSINSFKPEIIVHFAAESHVDNSISGPGKFIETNILGTYNLLQESKKYLEEHKILQKVIIVSTDEVYGSLEDSGQFNESSPLLPNSPYSASKASGDLIARAFTNTYEMPIIITHCSNNYGPFQYPEKLIPVVFSKIQGNESIPVYGNGQNVRDWIHVDDHVSGIHAVINRGEIGEVYNFGGEHEVSNISLVEQICSEMDELNGNEAVTSRELISFVTDRKGHDWRYSVSNEKSKRLLDWHPKIQFNKGLRDTLEWYQTFGAAFFAEFLQ